jgi:hypothetical protein
MTSPDDLIAEVKRLQDSMGHAEPSWCTTSDRDGLRGLIRLTVETKHFFDTQKAPEYRDLRYQCESTFAAISSMSFQRVAAIYRLAGHQAPAMTVDVDSIKEMFASKYLAFCGETDFDIRCCLLLDLFRLQIIFAAINYR